MQEMNASDWLRVLGKGFVVLLPMLAIWAYIWLCPMAYVDGEIPNYLWTKEQINDNRTADYQVIFLGDSVGNSVAIPEILSEKTINLALGGQTPVEQYFVLKNYLTVHRPPKVCYITFADTHLQQAGTFYERTVYSHVLPLAQEWEIIREAKAFQEKSIAVPHSRRMWGGYALRLPSLYLPALINAHVYGRSEQNRAVHRRAAWHRGTYMSRGALQRFRQYNKYLQAFHAAPFFDLYYRKILQLCEENAIQARVIRPPGASDIYSDHYEREVHQYYAQLKNDFPSFSFDELKTGFSYSDFADIHHMNNHGSYKFSKRVKAMYPEDFADDTPASRATVEGILDYIRMENRPDMLLKWIEDKPLTAVCFLRTPDAGKSDAAFADALRAIAPGARAEAVSSSGTRCLVLRGVGSAPALASNGGTFTLAHPAFAAPIRFIDETYAISAALPGEKAPRPIVKSHATALSVVILDDQTQAIAAVKNFLPLYGRYELMD